MRDEITNEKQQLAAVADKRSDPPGVMRKSIQSWLILAIAILILLLIWFTGGTKAKPAATQNKPSPFVVNTNATPEDIARHLLAEQREQAQTLLAQTGIVANLPNAKAPAQPPSSLQERQLPQAQPVDPVAEDARKRKYTSLFSSSIALSYREPQIKTAPKTTTQQPTEEQLAAAIASLPISPYPPITPSAITPEAAVGRISTGPTAPTSAASASTGSAEHRSLPANLNQASGKDYTIFEGTFLDTVLTNRLDGDFNGPVICMLTNDVYSLDRQHLLIPAGSKLLGETKHVDGIGQRRLAVSFHRLIMPDGYSLDLDRFQGLNQIGETGLKDKVNNHYFQIFGTSIAIGAIAGMAEAGTQVNAAGVQSATDAYRQGISSSLSQSSLHILDKFLNILPTIAVREGHRVKVYLTQDVLVPDYARHQMPANL